MHATFTSAPAKPTLPARLLTTADAGRYAAISTKTLYRLARRGELHPIRLGVSMTRWDVADIDAWIDRAAAAGAAGGAA